MILHSDRKTAVSLIDEAHVAGARKWRACGELDISVRTYQRWVKGGTVNADQRPLVQRPAPQNKLTESEKNEILTVANSTQYQSLPPCQIVPALVDEGVYIASESSFYRTLREQDQVQHRGRSNERQVRPIATHCASRPNELWCWDITWLPGPVLGTYFYLYLIMDIYSRKIVGHEVYAVESAENASVLMKKAMLAEGATGQLKVLHQDNGSPMKAATFQATLEWLQVSPSFSRPRVSNDNAFSESLFHTFKYRPSYPVKGFADIEETREFCLAFSRWYNQEHKHSGLKFISPVERHTGLDQEIMSNRKVVYELAKARHPERWRGATRNWNLPDVVWLNPVKEGAAQKAAA
jgi:transposase InsO family protein